MATSADCEGVTDCYTCLDFENALGQTVCHFCFTNSSCYGATSEPFECWGDDEWNSDNAICSSLTSSQWATVISIAGGVVLAGVVFWCYYNYMEGEEEKRKADRAKKQRQHDKQRQERDEQESHMKIEAPKGGWGDEGEEKQDRGMCGGEHEIYGEDGCNNDACAELDFCDPMCPGCPDMEPLKLKFKQRIEPKPRAPQVININAEPDDRLGGPSPPVVQFEEFELDTNPSVPAPALARALTATVLVADSSTSEDDSD